jgi:hypothetical protein
MNWIFLNKNNTDEYIQMFAAGCGVDATCLETWQYEDSDAPLVLRGIMKHKIIKRCWQDSRPFYYMDSGYLGNRPNPDNPSGWKYWHRIVKNNLQHDNEIIPRPGDRWERFKKKIEPWKKDGKKILLALPDEKPCKFYDIDLDKWTVETIDTIRKYTDRPIEIRARAKLRTDRTISNTLKQALDNDVFALVTFNSNAATESVMYGIPAFVLAPCSAAKPVTCQDLSQIATPYYPDQDKIYAWASHLAYGQFHNDELVTGRAKEMLEEFKE